MSAHVTPLQLDELALGVLPPEQKAALEAHVAGCARCKADLAEHTQAREHFSAAVLPKTLGAVRARAEAEGFGRPKGLFGLVSLRKFGFLLAPLAAAAAILLFLKPQSITEPDVLTKGGASVSAFARRGDRVFAVSPSEHVRPGDAVRLVLQPGPQTFALVLSVDSLGHVTQWFPQVGPASAPIAPRQRLELPGSIVLDATPGTEHVFALLSGAALDAPLMTSALEHADAKARADTLHRLAPDAELVELQLAKDTP
ncbi:MAG: zf-HC2 domain-containing protein [Deltaproteobacteria bacterium]|nr:zf-HC2 domain-containing protein [Deltaproteobacteria bacterium]